MRKLAVAFGVVVVGIGVLSGQGRRQPATLDDLLSEVRALRGELNEAAGASIQAQLLVARLTLQEGRINTLAQQAADVRQQLSATQGALAPFAAEMKRMQDARENADPQVRAMFEQMQKQEQQLRRQEAELVGLIAAEQARWSGFNARLDDLERVLSGR
jgi:hypothetical protein